MAQNELQYQLIGEASQHQRSPTADTDNLGLLCGTESESGHHANYSEWHVALIDACTIGEVDWILTPDGTQPSETDNRTLDKMRSAVR